MTHRHPMAGWCSDLCVSHRIVGQTPRKSPCSADEIRIRHRAARIAGGARCFARNRIERRREGRRNAGADNVARRARDGVGAPAQDIARTPAGPERLAPLASAREVHVPAASAPAPGVSPFCFTLQLSSLASPSPRRRSWPPPRLHPGPPPTTRDLTDRDWNRCDPPTHPHPRSGRTNPPPQFR